MRDRKTSLFIFIGLSCAGMALLPMIIYSCLSLSIFGRGLDAITKGNLSRALQNYVQQRNERHIFEPGIVDNKITIINNYSKIPQYIRSNLPSSIRENHLYLIEIKDQNNIIKNVYGFIALSIEGIEYYAYQDIPKIYAETFIKPQALQTIYILLATGILIFIFLFIFIKILIKQISKPILNLSNWAYNLNSVNIDQPIPDLVYPELYKIAHFIQHNLSLEYERLKKEEIFWRYCSHELRTPVTAISIGIELLQKKADNNLLDSRKINNILLRLRRSTFSISNIIETLLWMGNNKDSLLYKKIDLSDLINDIISDMNRIFYPEQISINLSTSPYILNVPEIAARIVLENVIRNAYQHSFGNQIFITQYKNIIKVYNSIIVNNDLKENIGFGLGLELAQKLAERLGWEIKILKDNEHNIVIIKF